MTRFLMSPARRMNSSFSLLNFVKPPRDRKREEREREKGQLKVYNGFLVPRGHIAPVIRRDYSVALIRGRRGFRAGNETEEKENCLLSVEKIEMKRAEEVGGRGR